MADLHFAQSLSRLGTESAFIVLARAQKLAAEGRDIINLGIGQPDFRTPDHIVEAGIKALRDGHHGYTPANGLPVLREAVAADLNTRHGVEVNPDNVVVVPGGKPTMFFALLMFGEPGAEIMYPNGVVALSMKRSERALPETDFRRCVRNWGGQVRSSG
jgi:aspartate/methionine/tyrosine aminotransferase